jgi:hypothetical protein
MKKNKHLNCILQLALFLFIISLLSSCKITKGVSAIVNKDVKPQYYSYKDKTVIFTPLTHFGQKEYYESLKDSLIHWKKNGFTVFYEKISSGRINLGLDIIAYDRLLRSFRRIDGGNSGTSEDYEAEVQKVFKNGIGQPDYADLGIDSTDIHADITLLELVNKIEELYGEIKLDSCDFATALDSAYNCSKGFKLKKLEPVYVDYRNEVVVEKIMNSKQERIIVLFGSAHIKGMKKLLKNEEITRTNVP